jgi:glyoxylase-like metal-dependent hydrolase (beta-lactamase superfamily II)
MIEVITFNYGNEDLTSNTYLLIDENKNVVVIDPSKNYSGICDYIEKNSLKLTGIFLTHGHFDHFQGVDVLVNKFNKPLFCHFDDVEKLTSPNLNCSVFLNQLLVVNKVPQPLRDGEILKHLLSEEIKVIHTPFHTSGSVCYYLKQSKILISGDTLFRLTIGRSDLPTGSDQTIHSSLRKLKDLPDDVVVYPGHGYKTTIGFEKMHNSAML